MNFGSNQGILAGCTVPSGNPLVFTELCSSVPVNTRCAVAGACTASEVRFDGGDFIQTSGGPLSIVHSQDPLTQFIGGSTEMLSKQAVGGALSYSILVGEDLYSAFGCPDCVMEPFHYVALNLVAFEDGTNVFVDSPGAGTVSFTLNKGEHWNSLGFIDDNPLDPTIQLTINSGTKVSTTAPIAGMLFTGGDGQWATRHYTLLPDLLHSTDYLITAPGDDPAVTGSTPDRPLNLYLFNPDPLNPVTVTATDTVGTTAIVIPANSVVDYFTGTGRFVPNGSTVRMISNRNFWGISGYDYNTNISDWGHSWPATKFLTQNYTVSFAPGTLNPPVDMVNFSAVFVAATADNTRVQVDFDNDGVFDVIDLDGDGIPDPAPLPGNTYLINALQSLRVFDPNDFDNTGTRIVANKPIGVAWGQDTDLTDFGDTALDTGYTVYPTNQLFLDPVLTLDKAVDVAVIPTAGGVATYTLTISTFGFGPITSLLAYDLLPTGVVGADYVAGSTLVTYPDLTQDTADPTTPTMLVAVDPLVVFGNSLLIEDGPGATPIKGFTRQADMSAAAGFIQGFAALSFNFRRDAFEGGDVVTLDVDYDNDGTFNDVLGTFNIPGGGTDATWQSASFVLDSAQLPDDPVVFRFITTGGFSAGTDNFYVDNVRLCNTEVTVNVDETDPDFPPGATLSTANDPQTLQLVLGGSVAATLVGYEPPPLTFTKTSSAGGEVLPGETITYTIEVTNNTSVTPDRDRHQRLRTRWYNFRAWYDRRHRVQPSPAGHGVLPRLGQLHGHGLRLDAQSGAGGGLLRHRPGE